MVPKMITFVIIVIASCGQLIGEGPQLKATPSTSTSTIPPSTTPSTKPTTTSVTSTSTTTQHTTPTKPTTPPPTEPTTNPPTTTDKPYPVPTTNTTTPKPGPTTPSPQPPKKPEVGKWNVTDHTTNVTCILVDMAIQLNISYIGNNNKTNHSIVYVPKSASANGDCGGNSSSQILDLEWELDNKPFGNLGLVFSRNGTIERFVISYINSTVAADGQIFPSINKTEDFEPSSSPDIVPIPVGYALFGLVSIVLIVLSCALAGLVAIVLIAYLVARRRSQAQFLSM